MTPRYKARGKTCPISPEEREQILSLVEKGLSNTEVGSIFKRARGTISRVRRNSKVIKSDKFFNWGDYKEVI